METHSGADHVQHLKVNYLNVLPLNSNIDQAGQISLLSQASHHIVWSKVTLLSSN